MLLRQVCSTAVVGRSGCAPPQTPPLPSMSRLKLRPRRLARCSSASCPSCCRRLREPPLLASAVLPWLTTQSQARHRSFEPPSPKRWSQPALVASVAWLCLAWLPLLQAALTACFRTAPGSGVSEPPMPGFALLAPELPLSAPGLNSPAAVASSQRSSLRPLPCFDRSAFKPPSRASASPVFARLCRHLGRPRDESPFSVAACLSRPAPSHRPCRAASSAGLR